MRYLFVTAGIGSPDLERAGLRIVGHAKELGIFDKTILVTENDLRNTLRPYLDFVPEDDMNLESKFGFFAWKPLIAKLALDGYWGDFESVCYLDAGCEILPSLWTRRNFLDYLEKASEIGAIVFHSLAPEKLYTTRDVFKLFPEIDLNDATPQIQGGTWFLGNQLGSEISSTWYDTCKSSYTLMTNSVDFARECADFVAPRNDQSFFSLTCKTFKIFPEAVIPPGGGKGIRTQIRSIFFPFRWARNRTGKTENDFLLSVFGKISLVVYFKFKAFRNT